MLKFVQAQDDFGGLCETQCALKIFQNGTRTLKVQYLVDGQPVANAAILFAAKDAAQTLVAPGGGEIPTDDNGFAQLDVKSGSDVGAVVIAVTAKDDPLAAPVEFNLQVATKAKGPMEIRLQYEGFNNPADYTLIQARLTKQEAAGQIALPDVLDLMVVCVEAGLGLDQAILTVARELQTTHPMLCNELSLVNLEMRAGMRRADALHNFSERTGEKEVRKLVAILIQTDRFGTSIADALRVYSDTMRTRRRQRVEEQAAKVGTKLLFPLILCIFPGLLFVLVGPAVLQMVTMFMSK